MIGWLVGLGVLAGPGTPRDPKTHLFGTNWVAIKPFWTSPAGNCAEFRRASRQIGPTPSISTFFDPFLTQKCPKLRFWVEKNAPARNSAVGSTKVVKRSSLGGPGGGLAPPYSDDDEIFHGASLCVTCQSTGDLPRGVTLTLCRYFMQPTST